jgi:hypothetical protein
MKIILIFAFIFVALFVYTLVLCSDEALYTHRGTYACWVCISPTIRNVPEIGHAQGVVFHSSSGDGPKPPGNAVSYITDAPAEVISRKLSQYFLHRGIRLHFSSKGVDRDIPVGDQPFVEAFIEPVGDKRTQVTVKETL